MTLQTTPPRRTIEKKVSDSIIKSVDVDGSMLTERFLIRINGIDVPLTGKSFEYFTKLAWYRKMQPAGWIWKEDLEFGWNQARYIYRMKGEIADVIGASWPVVENNRLGYYRLDADPRLVSFNAENLREYPDISISKFFDGTLA